MKSIRTSLLAAAMTLGLSYTAGAQALATFGSAEAAGLGEGSALLGTSMTAGHLGWGPVISLIGQTYRYRDGANSHAQAWALSPSVGLHYAMPEGSVQAAVGYTFVNTDVPVSIIGVETGSENSTFVSAQANYWGSGENTAQAIASWGFKSEYYWTRLRAAHRLAPSATPFYVGAELVVQGSQKDLVVPVFGTSSAPMRYEVGPTIEYRFTPEFRMGASGGLRGGNNNAVNTGYARIEFLLLSKL